MISEDYLFYFLSTSCLGLAFWIIFRQKTPSNYPPGPKGFPFIGVLPFISKYLQRSFAEWSQKKYGPIMSAKLMGHNLVVLNTFDSIKQAFEVEGDKTAGRFDSFLFGKLQGNYGIAFVDATEYFLNQKEFGLKFQRNYGGVEGFDKVINKELDVFLERLESEAGKPIEIKRDFFDMVGNVITTVFLGTRNEYGSPVATKLFSTFQNIFGDEYDSKLLFVIEQQPVFRFFPPFYFAYQRYLKRTKPSMDWIKWAVRKARENFDQQSTSADFLQHYLKNEHKICGNEEKSDKQLVAYMRDCLGAIRNVYTTLRWTILCALKYPEYHKRVISEIDQTFEQNDSPSYNNQTNFPITRAFIEETLRLCSPLPKPLERKTLAEISLGKYIIPKGTELAGNFYGANHNPEDWPDPNKFDPYRHINKQGSFISPTKVIQFSLGPRRCFGQYLARPLLLATFTRLLQRYEVLPVEGRELPRIDDGYQGITYDAKAYDVIIRNRM